MTFIAKLCIYFRKPDFVIEIMRGHALVTKGAALARLIHACTSLSKQHNIAKGCILGYSQDQQTRLEFHGPIPRYLHSALRQHASYKPLISQK